MGGKEKGKKGQMKSISRMPETSGFVFGEPKGKLQIDKTYVLIYFIIWWLGDASRAVEAPGHKYRSRATWRGIRDVSLLSPDWLIPLLITSTTAVFCSKLHKTEGLFLIGWMDAGEGKCFGGEREGKCRHEEGREWEQWGWREKERGQER